MENKLTPAQLAECCRIAMETLRKIAADPRKTVAQRYAQSVVAYLDRYYKL